MPPGWEQPERGGHGGQGLQLPQAPAPRQSYLLRTPLSKHPSWVPKAESLCPSRSNLGLFVQRRLGPEGPMASDQPCLPLSRLGSWPHSHGGHRHPWPSLTQHVSPPGLQAWPSRHLQIPACRKPWAATAPFAEPSLINLLH